MVRAETVGMVIQRFRKSKKMSQEVLSGLAGLDSYEGALDMLIFYRL